MDDFTTNKPTVVELPHNLSREERDFLSEYVFERISLLCGKRPRKYRITRFDSVFSATVEITDGSAIFREKITKDGNGFNFSGWEQR